MLLKRYSVVFLGVFFLSQITFSAQFNNKNDLTLESRFFQNDDLDHTEDYGGAAFLRSENQYLNNNVSINVRGYGRVAVDDSSRNIAAFEDAWIMYRPSSGWAFKAGIETLTWTATEGFHPADIINSVNYDSNMENPEKLGQPLMSVRRDIGLGNLTLFYFPDTIKPKLAESSSRLSFIPAGYVYDGALWFDGEKEDEQLNDQWATRFEQTLGSADIAVHYVEHYDRQQPVYLDISDRNDGSNLLRPVYFKTKNLGLTYAQVIDALIIKLEHNYKDFQISEEDFFQLANRISGQGIYQVPKNHHQFAAGLEYALYHDSGRETSFYLEGQVVSGLDENERSLVSAFQRDLLIGFRYAFNDVMSREFVGTAIIDMEHSEEYILTFSYRQRLSNVISANAGIRLIDAANGFATGLSALEKSDHIFLNISYHF